MTEFKRKKNENFETFLRRFNKKLIQSKKLNTIKERQYLIPKKNKSAQKQRALKGIKLNSKNTYLKKIGKLKDNEKFTK
ncbi:MAG: hypothetical protein V1768_02080 [Patescibacteria group bacterium]|nr:hypothetical protein [Patescibacteria group bacterium]MBU1160665.1 hypothetical protein [Patescibacteria group bacterium]MBU1349640.1 hypothetical protein [Patescibacteria group bacterium]MBU1421276.1 hypothetical protein [Patescibacteria group bacterium]MBU1684034.1 hypothetical protein [Patescibacteria group bacterium]